MLRRLHHEQPTSFAFTPANQAWAEAQVTKYPEGRQASAIIPLLWRAQEQEGWLTRPAIEHVSDMLGLAYIRGLEVASFYFMFQLQPVGSVAHIQVCGTTSCMICGAEDLIGVCKEKIAARPHELSADGRFSWEEVECLGACANAPMAQIGKDYYEDLTAERMAEIIDELAAGNVPVPGPQNGRYASEPKSGLTSLKDHEADKHRYNASAALATDIGDTVKRIDGTEVALRAPWQQGGQHDGKPASANSVAQHEAKPTASVPADATGIDKREAQDVTKGRPVSASSPRTGPGDTPSARPGGETPAAARTDVTTDETGAVASKTPARAEESPAGGVRPAALEGPRGGKADDLKMIKGIGPKLEKLCNSLGFYHFDQIATWSEDEIAWVDQNLEGFKGRVTRDNWVDQADTLSKGGETDFASRVKKGDVY